MRKITGISFLYLMSEASYGQSVAGAEGGSSLLLLQTGFGLLLVLGCIFLLAWGAKKLNLAQVGGNKNFSIVASLALGAREKAVLIQAGDQQILLGVAPGCVSQLRVFDEEIVTSPRIKSEKNPSLSASTETEFSKKLSDFISQGKKSE